MDGQPQYAEAGQEQYAAHAQYQDQAQAQVVDQSQAAAAQAQYTQEQYAQAAAAQAYGQPTADQYAQATVAGDMGAQAGQAAMAQATVGATVTGTTAYGAKVTSHNAVWAPSQVTVVTGHPVHPGTHMRILPRPEATQPMQAYRAYLQRGAVPTKHSWKQPWSEKENEQLRALVDKHGPKSWALIAKEMHARSGKQCRERWLNHLNPEVRKDRWTPEEDEIIFSQQAKLGNKWTAIAKMLQGRTANSIKNRFYSAMRRMEHRQRKSRMLMADGQKPSGSALAAALETQAVHPWHAARGSALSIDPAGANVIPVTLLPLRAGITTLPQGPHQKTIIVLHKAGESAMHASSSWLAALRRQLAPEAMAATRVVAPAAPPRAAGPNGDLAWCDDTPVSAPQDDPTHLGAHQSGMKALTIGEVIALRKQLHELVQKEVEMLRGDTSSLIICGAGMGGILALDAGVTFNGTLGGVMCVDSYLHKSTITALALKSRQQAPNANCAVPLYFHAQVPPPHGMRDYSVPMLDGCGILSRVGFNNMEIHVGRTGIPGTEHDASCKQLLRWGFAME